VQLIQQHDNAAELQALQEESRERSDDGTNSHGRAGFGIATDGVFPVAVPAERALFSGMGLPTWRAAARL